MPQTRAAPPRGYHASVSPHRRAADRLERLRQHRVTAPPDLSLKELMKQTGRDLARARKQLAAIAPLWESLLPPDLLPATRLESFSRGVLRVAVASSSHLHRLDGLLRQGLTRGLITQCRTAPLRRVQLRLSPLA